jgi:hypothetical protein
MAALYGSDQRQELISRVLVHILTRLLASFIRDRDAGADPA